MTLLATNELFSFCYGSNMKLTYLRDHCPSARPVMHGFLPNYRIEFRRYSADMGGGISTIIEHPGGLIRGVLCAVREEEIEALDILEDVPQGLYKRESFCVLGEDNQWHLGDLYRIVKPEGPFIPADGYLDLMLEGAREHGLPEDYIESIAARRRVLDQS